MYKICIPRPSRLLEFRFKTREQAAKWIKSFYRKTNYFGQKITIARVPKYNQKQLISEIEAIIGRRF